MKRLFGFSLAAVVAAASPALADTPILQLGDLIRAIDVDPAKSHSDYPDGEAPKFALDGLASTKYLNFAKLETGLMVTPASGASTITGIQFTTAGDAPERDPASWALYGTNDVIDHTLANDGDSTAFNWTLISQDLISLPDTRNSLAPALSFANAASYASYRVVFPTVKDAGAANSMQIADVGLLKAGNVNVVTVDDPVSAIQLPQPDSSYPAGEAPSFLLDADGLQTKYLNFGKENSGFIVTPALGASVVGAFQLTTANDAPERDPASWVLYGTNDDIDSVDNSDGSSENWVQIGAGDLGLPTARDTASQKILVNNTASFLSYRMVFPTLRDGANANSLQLAGAQFYAVPEPSTLALVACGLLATGWSRRRR